MFFSIQFTIWIKSTTKFPFWKYIFQHSLTILSLQSTSSYFSPAPLTSESTAFHQKQKKTKRHLKNNNKRSKNKPKKIRIIQKNESKNAQGTQQMWKYTTHFHTQGSHISTKQEAIIYKQRTCKIQKNSLAKHCDIKNFQRSPRCHWVSFVLSIYCWAWGPIEFVSPMRLPCKK